MLWCMVLLICKHIHILFFFYCVDCGPWTILLPHKGLKLWCRFIIIFYLLEKSNVQYVIWLWYHPVTKGLNIQHENIHRKIWKSFYTESIIPIHCPDILYMTPKSWLYYRYSWSGERVTHGPLVFNAFAALRPKIFWYN